MKEQWNKCVSIKTTQHATVIAHEELFEACRATEELKAPFFTMYNNISKKVDQGGLQISL
jgi:hypothetical protein